MTLRVVGQSIEGLHRMEWFDGKRARAYRLLALLMFALAALATVLTARHGIALSGKPLGTDFLAFWSASKLALGGNPGAPYDLALIYAAEKAAVPIDPGPSSFLYPPPFLLVCLPLALLPYLASLALWIAATLAAYVVAVRSWLAARPEAARGAVLTILAYPAVLINAGHGQNGFLTAALLGSGLWLLGRRPWLAGALLGALIIKPQIALAIPVLVLAGGRWQAAVSGCAAAAFLCVLSWLVLGEGAWAGFFAGSETGRAILDQGLVDPAKMVSVFAAARLLDGSAMLAYGLQALVAAGALAAVAIVARRCDIGTGTPAAVCAAATPLISPFFLDYDLTVLAFPMAWLLCEGLRRGFLAWEKLVLTSAFLLPLLARGLALEAGVPVAPIVTVSLLAICTRAALQGACGRNETRAAWRRSAQLLPRARSNFRSYMKMAWARIEARARSMSMRG